MPFTIFNTCVNFASDDFIYALSHRCGHKRTGEIGAVDKKRLPSSPANMPGIGERDRRKALFLRSVQCRCFRLCVFIWLLHSYSMYFNRNRDSFVGHASCLYSSDSDLVTDSLIVTIALHLLAIHKGIE